MGTTQTTDPFTWAVVREDTPTIPAYRLWIDSTDCGLFMTQDDADQHARLIHSLQEQMTAEGCA
jgi:hypothetical protein